MKYRIRRHPRFAHDLAGIADLVTEYAGPDSALRIVDEIEAAVRSLDRMPHRAAPRPDVLPGLRVLPAAANALIVFRVDDDSRTVFIRLISYAGADWMRRIKARG